MQSRIRNGTQQRQTKEPSPAQSQVYILACVLMIETFGMEQLGQRTSEGSVDPFKSVLSYTREKACVLISLCVSGC